MKLIDLLDKSPLSIFKIKEVKQEINEIVNGGINSGSGTNSISNGTISSFKMEADDSTVVTITVIRDGGDLRFNISE